MIEQQVEKRIMEQVVTALAAANVEGVKVYGAWQVEADKAVETADADAIASVRVNPREYATPTIPHATFSATVALTVRAETDATAALRLAATDAIASLLFSWQDSFDSFAAAFADIDGFRPCGFTLSGGDVGIDRAASVWNYSHNFTIHAALAKNTKGN